MNNLSQESVRKRPFVTKVAYSGQLFFGVFNNELTDEFDVEQLDSISEFRTYLDNCSIITSPEVFILELGNEKEVLQLLKSIRSNPLTSGAIILLLLPEKNERLRQVALKLQVNDCYEAPFAVQDILERLRFLIKFKLIKPDIKKMVPDTVKEYKMPFGKRLFDVCFASLALLLLSPLFLIIAILIKLESRGPVFYTSKRTGTGYKIFDFYKFRSMVIDADKKLAALSKVANQYAESAEDQKSEPLAFVKIKNDPRVTRVGRFIRNTSIDELPQLFNVLKGDMSIVGNRPLPLYEAELLTSNLWSMRFLGPAGITGLWQISKRGKTEMSDEERKGLDNYYAKNKSFWMDLKIICRTFPALFQQEKV